MVTSPRVSVLLPFHRVEPHLNFAIASVFAQSFQDWELLLVRDGSQDDALPAASILDHPKIRLIGDDRSLGLAGRLNWAIPQAQGEYVARLDSDDAMVPNRLENQIKYLERHEEVDVLGSGGYLLDGQNNLIGKRMVRPGRIERSALLRSNQLMHPSVMYRRDWALRNQYSPMLRRTEDLELWIRASRDSEMHNTTDPLIFYRVSSVQSRYVIDQTHSEQRVIIRMYERQAAARCRRLAESRVKQCAKRVANSVGIGSRIQHQNIDALNSHELNRASSVLHELEIAASSLGVNR